ncbi:DUF2189 domain-containing protein [Sphingomicrobium sediminis]|uniref:DUF2189 domain-containing protein n=1 Tax=Sphingomicrobium sediminis TaxID=2950949 RepID=A0A9X2EHY0_9SPHN|nr:DUF2189 domain-containing protein [Sphingomicrobium sediminis]MCM8558343.1 DUF2189 domain-containing protein [Sphingomicrobium sediminis]
MSNDTIAPLTGTQVREDLRLADLRAALGAGVRDFLAYPLYGLFFSAIYVVAGLGLLYAVARLGQTGWLIPAIAGFPIVAPFAAVGLYEVSRRREKGQEMRWGPVLGALRGRGDDQIMLMGAFIFVLFTFWVILAHGISLIFLASAGPTAHSLAILATTSGIAMLVVGGAVGGMLALILFAMTVTSLPMLVDRKVDAITAIIASLKVVRRNAAVMLAYATLVAIALLLALLPLFLGLLVVLPVLGHATWHLYRRAIPPA